jgi:hypothetical protein
MILAVAAHGIFMGKPVGPLHAMNGDRTLCDDHTLTELTPVQIRWADAGRQQCPACAATAKALDFD